jgi:hypothetical protein
MALGDATLMSRGMCSALDAAPLLSTEVFGVSAANTGEARVVLDNWFG